MYMTTNEIILCVDMDGTMAVWKKADYFEVLLEQGYFLNLTPQRNVLEAIKLIKDRGIRVCSLSAYIEDSKYALQEKNLWLDRYAPYIKERIFCPSTETKPMVFKSYYGFYNHRCILLDDYSHNLHIWNQLGGTGIKLMNGINGTKGTWKGARVSGLCSPKHISNYIMSVIKHIQ